MLFKIFTLTASDILIKTSFNFFID